MLPPSAAIDRSTVRLLCSDSCLKRYASYSALPVVDVPSYHRLQ
jgi:hypothetical protein